jgi:hypothetical protein
MVRDFILSLIRTYVPMGVVGALTAVALWFDAEITEDMTTGVTAFAVIAATSLYYLAARLLETRFPWLSFLLGTPKDVSTPTYSNASTIPGEVVGDGEVAGR